MTRHSKNASSSGVFSYAERQRQLQNDPQSMRCSADNLRPVTHCFLCLQPAKTPNCCTKGHLGCRECFLQNILAQKVALKEAADKAAIEIESKKAEEEKKVEAERAAQVKAFLDQQQIGKKRSAEPFDLQESKQVKQEKSLFLESSAVADIPAKPAKREICCRGGGVEGSHPLSLKSLIPVNLPEDGNCPSCHKPLKGCVRMTVAKKCGHVSCHACKERVTSKHCFTCSAEVQEFLTIASEGTGFAAAGGLTESKIKL